MYIYNPTGDLRGFSTTIRGNPRCLIACHQIHGMLLRPGGQAAGRRRDHAGKGLSKCAIYNVYTQYIAIL